jgi:hypothetical protein
MERIVTAGRKGERMGNWRTRQLAALLGLLTASVATLSAYSAPGRAAPGEIAASVSGRVSFSGPAPAAPAIDMSSEPYCVEAQRNAPAQRRDVRVGAQSGLADVIVQIKGVAASASKAAPAEPVLLDQQGCVYQPPVLALRVSQPLVVRNSDNVLHNVHVSPKNNPPFNLGQPMAGMQSRRTFRAAELGIPVRCDIHDWMNASIGVFDHSFFAVTDAEGRFTIEGLPPGEYELEAWHATLGTRVQRIRVTDAGVSDISIVFGRS